MWSDFVGCTKSFAASCISSTELSQFNRAVGNSINSVHKMCTNEDYQKGRYHVICLKQSFEKINFRLPQVCNLHQKCSHWRNGMQNILWWTFARNQQSIRIRDAMLVMNSILGVVTHFWFLINQSMLGLLLTLFNTRESMISLIIRDRAALFSLWHISFLF